MSPPSHLFACAISEQEWTFPAGELSEERIEWGEAHSSWDAGWRISASDELGSTAGRFRLDRAAIEWLRAVPPLAAPRREGIAALRLITRRRVVLGESGSDRSETSIVIATMSDGSGSLISDPASFAERLLSRSLHAPPQRERNEGLPLLFRNGTASLLFHEAIGHAAEAGLGGERFPEWLSVRDQPAEKLDDSGAFITACDLRNAAPQTLRRWSFREIPLPRMSHVRVAASRNVDVPERRIEVLHAEEGSFDALSGELTITVSLAYELDRTDRVRVAPFRLRTTRDELASRLSGAVPSNGGTFLVICGAHGQRIPVSGESPDLVLECAP